MPNVELPLGSQQVLEEGVSQRVNANEVGAYVIPSLNPGTYNVSVAAPGFDPREVAYVEAPVELFAEVVREPGDFAVTGGVHKGSGP